MANNSSSKINQEFLKQYFEGELYGEENKQQDAPYEENDAYNVLVYDMTKYNGSVDTLVQDLHIGHKGSRFKTKFENVYFVRNASAGISKLNKLLFNVYYNADGQDSVTALSKGNVQEAVLQNGQALKKLRTYLSPFVQHVRTNPNANHEDRIFNEVGINAQDLIGLSPELYSKGTTLVIAMYQNTVEQILVSHRFSANLIKTAKKLGVTRLYSAHTHQPLMATEKYIYINPKTNMPEERILTIMVGPSAVRHTAYHTKTGGLPSNTEDIVSELVETKDGDGYHIRQNMLSVNGMIAVKNMLKPGQLERLNEITTKNKETLNKRIETILKHPLKRATNELLLLGIKMRADLEKKQEKYAAQKMREIKREEKLVLSK